MSINFPNFLLVVLVSAWLSLSTPTPVTRLSPFDSLLQGFFQAARPLNPLRNLSHPLAMPTQEILPSLPARTISSDSIEADAKRTDSVEEDTKSLTEPETPTVKTPPSALDVLLGRDRTTLREDPIVWSKGLGPFTHSLNKRVKNIFSMRFLYVSPRTSIVERRY